MMLTEFYATLTFILFVMFKSVVRIENGRERSENARCRRVRTCSLRWIVEKIRKRLFISSSSWRIYIFDCNRFSLTIASYFVFTLPNGNQMSSLPYSNGKPAFFPFFLFIYFFVRKYCGTFYTLFESRWKSSSSV